MELSLAAYKKQATAVCEKADQNREEALKRHASAPKNPSRAFKEESTDEFIREPLAEDIEGLSGLTPPRRMLRNWKRWCRASKSS